MPAEFLATLPEDIRGDASLQTIPDVPTLAKSYVSAQKLIGQNRLPAPDASWKPEQWDAFYKAVGRPEKPDGYKLPEDVKLADGLTIDEAKRAKAFEHFHKAGLTPRQVEEVMRYYFGTLNEAATTEKTAREQSMANGMAALQKEHGDKLPAVIQLANGVIAANGDDEFTDFLKQSGLANDPRMVRFLHKIAMSTSEDTLRGGRPILPAGDQGSALKEIERLSLDKEFQEAYNSRTHHGHADAVNRMLHLNSLAYPGKVQG